MAKYCNLVIITGYNLERHAFPVLRSQLTINNLPQTEAHGGGHKEGRPFWQRPPARAGSVVAGRRPQSRRRGQLLARASSCTYIPTGVCNLIQRYHLIAGSHPQRRRYNRTLQTDGGRA